MRRLIWAAMALLISSVAFAAGPTDINEIKRQRMAEEFVAANLKDPKSAEFRNQNGFCGEVNSKNSFGGYTGFQRFIAASREMVVFERDKNLERGAFDEAWNQFCR
ncbi:hypothetical protein [Bordetella genomosp. 4]|uniref:Uncharacterized protein n=1 Tax=Bordetella genomosp. 4 TaxID=463044 RepID=A0A261U6V3_9BORD|nr:hypothetical protein [Bordetella genomosp. 4]OZI57639.1 hypothetical protein CAL20_09695 [Bordetella genomosp. 4]